MWYSLESPLQEFMWMNSKQLIFHNKSQTQPCTWDNPPMLLTTAAPCNENLSINSGAPLEIVRAAFFISVCDGTLLFIQIPIVPSCISECLGLLLLMFQTPESGQAE